MIQKTGPIGLTTQRGEMMNKILNKKKLVENIYEIEVATKGIARKAKAGQFVVVMVGEEGERIPLTLADWSEDRGTITLVFMVVGTTSSKLSKLEVGDDLYAVMGPLGHASDVDNYGTVIMVAGGVGTAPIYPIAKRLKEMGNRVISIHGARSKDLLFWTDKLGSVSDEHIITTDDGSFGRKGLVTEPLKELLEKLGDDVGCVYAIGPAIMMKFCALTTKPFETRTVVSLNSIMVDGSGMCGACRVDIGGRTRFTCVDGPEFDGHRVDWNLLMSRQKAYLKQEKLSYDEHKKECGCL